MFGIMITRHNESFECIYVEPMMENTIIEFSGRKFAGDDIGLIKAIVVEYPNLSRSELAATICELIGWVQTNGNPKLTQCLSLLDKLDSEGIVNLPGRRNGSKAGRQSAEHVQRDTTYVVDDSKVSECGGIKLEIVRPGEELRRWRFYMNNYHELKDPHVYGAQLRYMIKSGTGRDLGCLLFSAASWALAPRDGLIGWNSETRKTHLHLIVNNSRFLLLPWVHVKFLASQALSMAVKRLPRDWMEAYSFSPVLIETFVDISKYNGTCYKAANWVHIGDTLGRGRNDRLHEQVLTRKAIYLYPLQKDYISVLNGYTPYKTVSLDELL